MKPEDVRVGDRYERTAKRVQLADERTRRFEVREIIATPKGQLAVTCKAGDVDRDGCEHTGSADGGCCGWYTSAIAADVNSGAMRKVTP